MTELQAANVMACMVSYRILITLVKFLFDFLRYSIEKAVKYPAKVERVNTGICGSIGSQFIADHATVILLIV